MLSVDGYGSLGDLFDPARETITTGRSLVVACASVLRVVNGSSRLGALVSKPRSFFRLYHSFNPLHHPTLEPFSYHLHIHSDGMYTGQTDMLRSLSWAKGDMCKLGS